MSKRDLQRHRSSSTPTDWTSADEGGLALAATFSKPHELRFDAQGDMFIIVDMVNDALRKIDMNTSTISSIYIGHSESHKIRVLRLQVK